MRKAMLKIFAVAALLASTGAQAQTVIGYDILRGRAPTNSGYAASYTGNVTPGARGYDYFGGSGSLNDSLVPPGLKGKQLFETNVNPVFTLHLSQKSTIDQIDLFGNSVYALNPGNPLTGATVTIGGVTVALPSTGWNLKCNFGSCDHRLSLVGTPLAGLVTDTVLVSNIKTKERYFFLAEISLHGSVPAVPEPETYAMMLAGLGLIGFTVRRRKRAA